MAQADADVIDALVGITPGTPLDAMLAAMDVHLGTPERVIASLQTDTTLARATDIAVQVHSIDPPHPFILRSIELVAEVVAPAFGWGRVAAAAVVAPDHESGR